jgi:hypothetical protein
MDKDILIFGLIWSAGENNFFFLNSTLNNYIIIYKKIEEKRNVVI